MDDKLKNQIPEFKPNVNLMKAFNSQIMLVDNIPNTENGLVLIKAGADGPPIHKHAVQDEYFSIVSGQLQVYQTNKWITLNAGDEIYTPKNMTHTYRSRHSEDCIFAYRMSPKQNFSNMMQQFEKLINEDKLKGTSDIRSLIYLSVAFKKYRSELTSVDPPQFVINILAGVGGLLGFKL
jgi:mannose-6-phosphate isomerase-like protein (cupin superfamily)